MYEEEDIDDAVRAGVFDEITASRFRNLIASSRNTAPADQERIPIKNALDDMLAVVALLLVAAGVFGITAYVLNQMPEAASRVLGPVMVAGLLIVQVKLSQYFAHTKKQPGPAILVFLWFVVTVLGAVGGAIALVGHEFDDLIRSTIRRDWEPAIIAFLFFVVAGGATLASWWHWRRFKLSITPAVIFLLVTAMALFAIISVLHITGLMQYFLNDIELGLLLTFTLPTGLLAFLLAMRFDMSDIYRQTTRSDIAFWFHIVAAVMIAHPLLLWIENAFASGSSVKPFLILMVYLLLTFVAVVINRRVFIFSGLAYLVKAVWDFGNTGVSNELVIAFATLPIGLGMLALSSHWMKARNWAMGYLPPIVTAQLPRTEFKVPLNRPVE